ncbi:MAG: Nif3-like dinuclear metal center hexameric protein [Bacteroidota bacterium]|jgi:dinuclear metal center YbgI/SA1388 family protein
MEKVKVKNISDLIESIAPLQLQEHYDNSGLLVGSPETEVTGILLCLDSTEEVVDEAIRLGCNLIIAHHPIIFSGLKKINGKNYVERAVIKAIKNNICIYAAHTNLDNIIGGVNTKIAEKLGLINTRILKNKSDILKKLVTFCPVSKSEKLREALFKAGAGHIGNYDSCSFNLEGIGTFRANDLSNPFVGNKNQLHEEREIRIELIFNAFHQSKIINALIENHPYEEVAYDIYKIENNHPSIGSGIVGELEKPMSETDFFGQLKKIMKVPSIKHTTFLGKEIRKVAICGGSGSFLIKDSISSKSDVYITSDIKYHEFFDSEGEIIIADIGHFESEQFTLEIFYEVIKEKFNTFAIRFSDIKTNPVNYF